MKYEICLKAVYLYDDFRGMIKNILALHASTLPIASKMNHNLS